MTAVAIKYLAAAVSMRQEIKILGYALLSACLLPILTVIILTQAGIDLVSGALVSNDQQAHAVEIHDPATGQVTDTVSGPFQWPVAGPVTLEFGQNDLPYQPLHTGIDIASPTHQVGDPVRSFMKGTVVRTEELSWGYGKHVEVDNGHHITSIYAHLDSIAVAQGQEVDVGTILGTRGTTGWSTGPHTHFEIRVFGIPVNPRTFLGGNP